MGNKVNEKVSIEISESFNESIPFMTYEGQYN